MSTRTTGLPHCQIFESEPPARAWLESRAWKQGPVCPHCGNASQKRITRLRGRSHRAGLYQCNRPSCRRQFTVTVGTILELSKIPLHKWLAALFLISRPGARVPVAHVHRALEISNKAASLMVHRLRKAIDEGEKSLKGSISQYARAMEIESDDPRWPAVSAALQQLMQGSEAPRFSNESNASHQSVDPAEADSAARPRVRNRRSTSGNQKGSGVVNRAPNPPQHPQDLSFPDRAPPPTPDEILRWRALGIPGPADDPSFLDEHIRWRRFRKEQARLRAGRSRGKPKRR